MQINEEAFIAALKAYDAYWENDMDPDEAMRCALRAYLTSAEMSSDIHTDEEVDDAISALRRVIHAAEHSNHNGECAVIKAARAINVRR